MELNNHAGIKFAPNRGPSSTVLQGEQDDFGLAVNGYLRSKQANALFGSP